MFWVILILLSIGSWRDVVSAPAKGQQAISADDHPAPRNVTVNCHNVSSESAVSAKDFPYTVILGHLFERKVELSWDIGDEDILFRLLEPITDGVSCIGLGFSPRGDERDADIAFISWSGEDDAQIMEKFTNGSGILSTDAHNDYCLERFQLHQDDDNGGLLDIVLKRRIDTKDQEDYKIEWGTTRTFIIVSDKCPEDGKPLNFTNMNVVEKPLSVLKSGRQLPAITPENSFSRDFVTENIQIPDASTTYWCHTLHFGLPEKVHGVKYEGLITEGNEDMVHHIELFHCEVPLDSHLPSYSGPCDDKPSQLKACSKVVAAWAMGAGPLVYPAEAGVPLGGPDWSPYLVLEVHFNNPQRLAGLTDNSGIRYYYSESLRPFDVGVVEVGVIYSPNLVVPTGEPDFTYSGICLSRCTSEGFPSSGVHVFASQLHTHLTGREVVTSHYRGDQELPPVDKDPHFTMMFQDIRLLPHDVTILPGDSLVTTCHYDTTNRETVTMGGLGVMNEMCINYLHYYPKTHLEVCKSTLSDEAVKWFLGETLGPNNENQKFSSVVWTERTKALWRQMVNYGPVDEDCLSSNGESFPGNWTNLIVDQPDDGVVTSDERVKPLYM